MNFLKKSIAISLLFITSLHVYADNSYYINLHKKNIKFIDKNNEIIEPEKPTLPDWIYTNGDDCGGLRQSSVNPNVYYARANLTQLTSSQVLNGLPIPDGFRHLSRKEYTDLGNALDKSYIYYNVCGINFLELNGVQQIWFSFKDNYSISSRAYEFNIGDIISGSASNYFAGYVLIKE